MSTNYRIEKDFLGEKQIPADAYYGVQTQRGKDNFLITGTPMSEISQRIFDAIIRHASGEKVRSEILGYGNDEFLPWRISAVK